MARRLGLAVGMLTVLLGACRADDEPARSAAAAAAPNPSAPRVGPLTPSDPDRITPAQREAIRRLAASTAPAAADSSTHDHGHGQSGPASTVVLDAADRATFEAQWDAAAAAVPALDTAAERAAAGYVRAAVQGAGVGVHWVDWTLIEAPFDPARPSMLLVDERAGRDDLVGFSYWVRSPDPPGPPAGFAGVNDAWHRHSNLCIVNGWVDREQVTSARECAGDLLAGADLWMLHAWVVPGGANPWGDFAVRHPALCPAATAPDIARCPDG